MWVASELEPRPSCETRRGTAHIESSARAHGGNGEADPYERTAPCRSTSPPPEFRCDCPAVPTTVTAPAPSQDYGIGNEATVQVSTRILGGGKTALQRKKKLQASAPSAAELRR